MSIFTSLMRWIGQKLAPLAAEPLRADGSDNDLYLYKRISVFFKPYWPRLLIAVLITIPIGALDGAIAWCLKPYVDTIHVGKSVAQLSYIPFIIVGFTLVQGMLNYTSIYLNGWLGMRILGDIRRALFDKLNTMDVQFFDKTASGKLILRYFKDPESVQMNLLNNTKQMLTRMFSSLFLIGVLVMTSWQLSIIAVGVLLGILYPSTRIRKIIKKLGHESAQADGDFMSFYTDTAGGIRVIYSYMLQPSRLKAFDTFQRTVFDKAMGRVKAQGMLTPSMHTIASIGVAVIIYLGSKMVVDGSMTTGAFVSFMAAMLMLYNPLKNLGASIMNAQLSLLAVSRVIEKLDMAIAVQNAPQAIKLPPLAQSIVLEQVDFEYKANQPVLKQVDLTIQKGQTVALVGPSGGGKSTIAQLLPRFYDVTQGRILIDGVDIRQATVQSLRAQIGVVFQDNFLFNDTIAGNLRAGKFNATDDELWQALSQANLQSTIEALPEGLYTQIGERGVMLSGGQRQRLAIARAFLKNAPILILDEATSALDNESESIVQAALERLMRGRTVIVIAHRLSTIRNADKIAVIEGGRVVEEGSHEQLMAHGQVYRRLYELSSLTVTEQTVAA
ncbi:MAG: ABC transporter ATP-binding protein [Vampirovibrionales bacterium]|nr:ABC transporter ATP-binding protein [Vampirovibrionales bacterium]